MTVIVRFAPSPTGLLHVGNVRTALFNWLFAKREGGQFLLRIDDTDSERSEARFEEAIKADLAWLGLTHDRFARQSDRTDEHQAAADTLKAKGLLYPCYETPDELERKRRGQLARRRAPVYDRAALGLTDADRAALEAEGRLPHWRFKLPDGEVGWTDLIRGETVIDLASVSDPVLLRSDGRFLYTLPSVVDDAGLAVSHVIRGEDHVTNTAAQIALFRALDAEPPAFAHHPLLVAADGGPLSKRLGSLSIGELRTEGYEALAVVSLLAKIGTSDAVEPAPSLDALADGFDFTKLGRAPARFDVGELAGVNAKLLHDMPLAAVEDRLAGLGIKGTADRVALFWEAVRPNLRTMADAAQWWRRIDGPVAPVIDDADTPVLTAARDVLPGGPFDDETWPAWTTEIRARTGLKGRALFQPLRLALTGLEHGPEMKKLLVLIGPERARARLSGKTA